MTILVWQVKQKPGNLADSGEPARLEPISGLSIHSTEVMIDVIVFVIYNRLWPETILHHHLSFNKL